MSDACPKPQKRALGEITRDLMSVYWTIEEENDGVLDAELEETVREMECEFSTKVDRCLIAHQQLESQADMWKRRAEAMSAMAKSLQRRADWLKSYVHDTMKMAHIKKIGTEHFPVVALQNNPVSVEITNEQAFIDKYRDDIELVETVYKPLKSGAKLRLQAGEELAGAVLITDRTHLRVK